MTALQRRQQIGRIHAAKTALGLEDRDYRELLAGLTGEESTMAMSDRQLNHVLDWMNFLSGRRFKQPLSFDRSGAGSKENLVRLCYAVCAIVPPGYAKAPLLSESWQTRMTGRFEKNFEAFDEDELSKLIEGLKSIFRRQGQRHDETLDQKPLWDKNGGAQGATIPPSSPIQLSNARPFFGNAVPKSEAV
jgi:hypothetical protein